MIGYLKRSTITVILLLLFIYIVIGGSEMRIQARLFTLAVGWIGIGIISVQLIREVLVQHAENKAALNGETSSEVEDEGPGGNVDFAITEEEKTTFGKWAAVEQFAWLWGMILSLWLFGFYLTVPVMVGLYLYRHSEKWTLTLPLAAGIWLTVWGLFHELLNLPFPQGIVLRWFGF